MLLGRFAAAAAVTDHDGGAAVFALHGEATDGPAAGIDWDIVFGTPTPNTTPRATPSAAGADEVFIIDIGNSDTGYAGSNKAIHAVNTWQWKSQKIVPDKDDIIHAHDSGHADQVSVAARQGGRARGSNTQVSDPREPVRTCAGLATTDEHIQEGPLRCCPDCLTSG